MDSEEDMILQLLQEGGASLNEARAEEDKKHSWGLVNYPLASVYAPLQEWQSLYDNETGLARGTIFKELEKPFLGAGGVGNGR